MRKGRQEPPLIKHLLLGFPAGSDSKASACNAGHPGSFPGWGRSPGEGDGNPLQLLLPGKFHGLRSLVGYSPMGSQRVGHNWVTSLSLHGPRALTGSWYLLTSLTLIKPYYPILWFRNWPNHVPEWHDRRAGIWPQVGLTPKSVFSALKVAHNVMLLYLPETVLLS